MAGTWQALVNQPGFNTSTMILLTDGRVMVQEEAEKHWHALTPDSNGSYVQGTWSTLKDMSFWRRYYASGVLKDGRVIVIGGEQSGDVPPRDARFRRAPGDAPSRLGAPEDHRSVDGH